MAKNEELKTIFKNLKSEALFAINEVLSWRIKLDYPDNYAELKRNGYTVIRSYCKDTAQLRLILEDFWKHDKAWHDSSGSDTRIWGGFEKSHDCFEGLFVKDKSLLKFYQKYISRNRLASVLMANKIVPTESNLGSGGTWHRDDRDGRQLKFILYLTDVSSENGNFRYIKRTHRLVNKLMVPFIVKSKMSKYRFDSHEINRMVKSGFEIDDVTGRAGDLIIVDTSGIHRGSPIKTGVRIAITNYLWNRRAIPDKILSLLIK